MRQRPHQWRFLVLVFALLFSVLACEEDHMRQGKAALVAGKPDVAAKHFSAVLKEEPESVEARRLMADVYREQDNFEKAEEQLKTLWKEQGFDDEEKDLSAREKTTRSLMEGQFEELYKEWAESLDASEESEKFERVVRAGLEIDPKSIQLNNMLVEFYEKRAERLVEQGKKLEAAESYENILQLRTSQKMRDEAKKLARNLRFEVFKSNAKDYFEKEVVPQLEEETWDAEKRVFTLEIETDIDRGLKPDDPEDKKMARKMAARSLALGLRNLTIQATPLEQDADFAKVGVPEHKIMEENFSRGTYEIIVKLSLDDVIKTAFAVKEEERKSLEEKAEKGEDEASEEKPAEGGKDAGAQTDGDAG